MNRFRKEDSEDPTHKWIGTYNSNLIHVVKFFKWLHYPNIEPTKRLKPEVVQNFTKLRRLEKSDYEPPKMQQDATGFKSYDKRVGEVRKQEGMLVLTAPQQPAVQLGLVVLLPLHRNESALFVFLHLLS